MEHKTTETSPNASRHTFRLEQRKNAQISGVTDVYSFHENEIILKVDGGTMVIGGEGLHVGKLLLDDGRLDVTGRVDSIVYEEPKAVSRLFRWKRLNK